MATATHTPEHTQPQPPAVEPRGRGASDELAALLGRLDDPVFAKLRKVAATVSTLAYAQAEAKVADDDTAAWVFLADCLSEAVAALESWLAEALKARASLE